MTNLHTPSLFIGQDRESRRLTMTVAVLTFHRPIELARGLPMLLEEVRSINRDEAMEIDAELLVVDNDPAGSAGRVVEAQRSESVHYVVETQPGISAARNRALAEARQSDLLVFIDDDEEPEPDWLRRLIATWRSSRPAAVVGHVVSVFPAELDPWLKAGRFFIRRTMTTGDDTDVAATNNLLLDLEQIRELDLTFDERLGLSGGEDTLFSRQLIRRGGRILWCNEAIVIDHVPPDRATRAWVLARGWSHGNTTSIVALLLAGTELQRALIRCRLIAEGLARLAVGSLRYVAGLCGGALRHQARGMRTIYRGCGMLAGAIGLVYQEYARDDVS